MLNKDEIKGNAKQAKGTIKENPGWLTDDHQAGIAQHASKKETARSVKGVSLPRG